MPIRKRGDAWQVIVCFHGQKHRRSSRHWTRDQAQEVERKLLDDLHAVSVGRKPERSFYEAVEKWRNEELPHYRDWKREAAHMKALAPYLEGKMLKDTGEVAEAVQRAGLGNRRLALLRRLVNLAWKEWGWLDQPLGQRVRMRSERRRAHFYLTRPQVEAIAKRMPRAGGYVLLAAYTGVRRGQLLRLTKADVVAGCLNLGTDGKTGQPQLIPLHPRVRAIAKKLPLCTDQILKVEWEAARKKVAPKARFHDLRHTAASWMIQAGGELLHVRDLLGHADVRTTQIYAHLKTEHLKKAVRRMQ